MEEEARYGGDINNLRTLAREAEARAEGFRLALIAMARTAALLADELEREMNKGVDEER